jgi:hypothetical protein
MTDTTTEHSESGKPVDLAPLTEVLGPRPVAWMWMQATFHAGDVRGRGWFQSFSTLEPKGMPWMVDKLTPLYDRAALAAERERCAKTAAKVIDPALQTADGDSLADSVVAAILGPNVIYTDSCKVSAEE